MVITDAVHINETKNQVIQTNNTNAGIKKYFVFTECWEGGGTVLLREFHII